MSERISPAFSPRVVGWAARHVVVHGRRMAYREAGSGPAMVFLHGIGSASSSWQMLVSLLAGGHRTIAWDAPGYGDSEALPGHKPMAAQYAQALHGLLHTLGVTRCVLVGHSLGALIASAYANAHPERVQALLMADPAQGYGSLSEQEREAVRLRRLKLFSDLGPEGYADQRVGALLHPEASQDARALAREALRRLQPEGFAQANWMLANDDIWNYLPVPVPTSVMCGEDDAITTPHEVGQLARRLGVPCNLLPRAGHASYLDAPVAFAAAVLEGTRLFEGMDTTMERAR